MPEGHTIHRLARDLNRDFRDVPVAATSPQGRFAEGAARIDGEVLDDASAWGKHLFLSFGNAAVVHIHLGLIGKFRKVAFDSNGAAPQPRDTIRLRLENDAAIWDLTGPNLATVGAPDVIAGATGKLGPDPLRRDGLVEDFVDRLGRRRVPIGAALLDQKVIAGIGNVYRSEILFLLGIDPSIPANEISEDVAAQIWELTQEQLRQGVKLNRIVTIDPADVGKRSVGRLPAGERLYVYKRGSEPCRRCGTLIRTAKIANRSMWMCPECQPPGQTPNKPARKKPAAKKPARKKPARKKPARKKPAAKKPAAKKPV